MPKSYGLLIEKQCIQVLEDIKALLKQLTDENNSIHIIKQLKKDKT